MLNSDLACLKQRISTSSSKLYPSMLKVTIKFKLWEKSSKSKCLQGHNWIHLVILNSFFTGLLTASEWIKLYFPFQLADCLFELSLFIFHVLHLHSTNLDVNQKFFYSELSFINIVFQTGDFILLLVNGLSKVLFVGFVFFNQSTKDWLLIFVLCLYSFELQLPFILNSFLCLLLLLYCCIQLRVKVF